MNLLFKDDNMALCYVESQYKIINHKGMEWKHKILDGGYYLKNSKGYWYHIKSDWGQLIREKRANIVLYLNAKLDGIILQEEKQ